MSYIKQMKLTIKKMIYKEISHITKQLDEAGLMDKYIALGLDFADQTAFADVIITPELYISDYFKSFANMTPTEL